MSGPRFWDVRIPGLDHDPCYVRALTRNGARYKAIQKANEAGYRVKYSESRAVLVAPPKPGHSYYETNK